MTLLRVGVLISGRGSNLEAILERQQQGELCAQVVVVGSNRVEAAGLDYARRAGVPVVVADRAEFPKRAERQARLGETLRARDVELLALAGYDEVIGAGLLEAFSNRILNIHPSLLPAFAGTMHAVRDALDHGVKVSGCTVHLVTADVDQGPILLQAAVPVLDDDDEHTLAARILAQEHRLLPEAIRLYAEGRVELDGRRVRIRPSVAVNAPRLS